MYHGDIEAAVDAGVIDADVARQLRNFSAVRHAAPIADEERFGLVGGLADVMTAVGLVPLLLGLAAAFLWAGPFAAVMVVAATWVLAEYFTRRRRMTLTSFVLFGTFALAVACGLLALSMRMFPGGALDLTAAGQITTAPISGMFIAAGTTLGCALWWFRFRLPFAYTACAIAAVNLGVHVLHAAWPSAPSAFVSGLLLATGFVLFALAMWWDMSDVRRETQRADVAFWLHWAAGYQISHAAFRILLGVVDKGEGWDRLYAFAPAHASGVLGVVVLFSIFCAVALVIDRRSLLLSSLIFVLPNLAAAVSDNPVIGGMTIAVLAGAFLVLLAGFWHKARVLLMPLVPIVIRAQLPRTELTFGRERPVA